MIMIHEDKRNRNIDRKETIKFSSFSSHHLIIIKARTKSEKQLGNNATDDEDLTVKVDNKIFTAIGSKKVVDSPAAFSGGGLHNLSKTVYFVVFLEGRDHEILLEADNPPGTGTFENLQIYTLSLMEQFTIESEVQAEDGDRRPWVTFVLDGLALKSISSSITYTHRKRDSDDVKVIIDGKTQGNLLKNIKYFLWKFAGSLLPWSTPTKTETEVFDVNLPKGLHYFELFADRMPILHSVVIEFGAIPEVVGKTPTVDDPLWTGDFYQDTEEMLLARAIYGEAGGEIYEAKIAIGWVIRNRVEDLKHRWGRSYHDVILAKYQYEPFNDPNSSAFKKITNPPLNNLLEKNAWNDSYKVAKVLVQNETSDPTKGSNHFIAKSLPNIPSWATKDKFTVEIGNTMFYKL